jgi:DNA polymerase
MQNVVIDFESYYDGELTVRRHGAINYLAQTNVYLVAVVGSDWEWTGDPRKFDWSRLSNAALWAHNFGFDGAYFLSRELPIPGKAFNCSANLVAWLGSPRALDKATRVLLSDDKEISKDVRKALKGQTWHELSSDTQEAVTEYCRSDARAAYQLVEKYATQWPANEQSLSQHTISMGWRGVGVDREKLDRYLQRVIEIRAAAIPEIPWALNELGAPLSLLQARAHCEKAGIEPPKSFAEKNEHFIIWETQHRARVPFVAAVARYRKAVILQARLEAMQRRILPSGRLSYDLKYFGAHTGRWSGSGGLNLQNLRKNDFHGISLRRLLVPSAGKKLIVADLCQIEPRVLCWLCGDSETLALIRAGYGFYEAQAKSWGLWNDAPGTLKHTRPELYMSIKRLALGAGYGMGPARFRATVAEQMSTNITLEEARRQLNDYRVRNRRVVAYWHKLDRDLQMSVGAGEMEVALPSGRNLRYHNLRRLHGDVYATFASEEGYRETKLWGGFLTENAVSGTARDIFAEGLLRLERAGLRVVLHIHDEYVMEVDPDVHLSDVLELLRQPPLWALDLPIDAEGWEGDCYAP